MACGAASSPFGKKDARCDLRPASPQCTDQRDFSGPSFATFNGVCSTLLLAKKVDGGVFEEGQRCDSSASLGGCQSVSLDGTKQTNWYYAGSKYPDAAAAKAECGSDQSFVEASP